jgi:hypothetical protein
MPSVTSSRCIRVNARLSGADAARFQDLLRHSGKSASELLRAALREYHAAHVRTQPNPMDLLAGYVGSFEEGEDLSVC